MADHRVICPICGKERMVSHAMAWFIKTQRSTSNCRSCASKGNKRRLGSRHTETTKLKMSIAHLGKRNSPEHNANISRAKMGVPTGIVPRSAFKKGLIKTKEQIRECLRRRPMSKLELKIQRVIDKYNLPYKFVGNGGFFIERKNPDFININGEKKAVEVYWKKHKDEFRGGGEKGWMRDRIDIFSKYGWDIIFIEGTKLTEEGILTSLKGGK